MAILNTNDRFEVFSMWMRENKENCDLSKAELRAALDSLDTWIDDNFAALTSSLPNRARTGLTLRQRMRLFFLTVSRRMERS